MTSILDMKSLITLRVTQHGHVSPHNISSLEKRCNHKLTLFEKIFLINLGSTQQLLEVLSGCAISIKIVRHEEESDFIRRDVIMFKKVTKQILLNATSILYKNELPAHVLEVVRDSHKGIGVILLKYNFGFYRKIREIGYNSSTSSVFRKYQILCNRKIVADIEEIFLLGRRKS
jgi:chorismate-pyruvate lyase